MRIAVPAAETASGRSPLSAGPHGAGFRRIDEIALSDDARYPDARPYEGLIYRCPESAQAILYYPAVSDGEDAPLASGGPFPVIAIAHARRLRASEVASGAPEGTSQDHRQHTALMAHLARRGYVVLALDLSWLAPDEGPARRAAALRDSIAHLRAGSRGPLLADFDRVGLIGHGLGGLAALTLAADRACPFTVRALGLLAPLAPDTGAGAEGPAVLVVRGTADTGSAGAGGGPAALYAAAPAPKHLVTIGGANHFGYTKSIALLSPFDGPAAIDRRRQQAAAKAYVAAFFDHYLRDVPGAAAWLRGERPIPELLALELAVEVEAFVPSRM